MSEVAEQAAEVTAELVEDTIDGVVETIETVRNNPAALLAAGVVGLAIGAAAGYFLAAKRLGKEFDEQMAKEIEQAKEFYSSVNKVSVDGKPLTPEEVMRERHGGEAADALKSYRGIKDAEIDISQADEDGYVEVEPGILVDAQDELLMRKMEKRLKEKRSESRNVFEDPGFDLKEELKYRTKDKPYVITHDEFFENEHEYENSSLTYFEVDDTLVDERDVPINDTDDVIGDDHLVRFGHGSKDKNIVYVRNDRLGIDYEITKSTGSYLEEVLGMEDDGDHLKHSDQRDRRREFRRGDE